MFRKHRVNDGQGRATSISHSPCFPMIPVPSSFSPPCYPLPTPSLLTLLLTPAKSHIVRFFFPIPDVPASGTNLLKSGRNTQIQIVAASPDAFPRESRKRKGMIQVTSCRDRYSGQDPFKSLYVACTVLIVLNCKDFVVRLSSADRTT